MESKSLNQITLWILAPLLMVVGFAGFVIPERYNLMSEATPYNLFHIVCGAIGLVLLSSTKSDVLFSAFNLAFGVIDLFQVVASIFGLSPDEYFLWTYTDDVIHVIMGFSLVIIGGYGIRKWKEQQERG